MGYTHYWNQKRSFTTAEWRSITAASTAVLTNAAKDGIDLLYEYDSNEPPLVNEDIIHFNGKGDDGHETFVLTRARRAKFDYEEQSEFNRDGAFEFCKTAQKPYDVAVTAVLLIARHHAPNAITLSSDGDATDWGHGLALARAAADNWTLAIPPELREEEEQHEPSEG